MIAVDTNALLRWILADDEEQSPRARRLFASAEEVLVIDVVLVEAIWVLKGKRYRLDAPAIAHFVRGLLEDRSIVFEDYAVVWSALRDFADASDREAEGAAPDFADALIMNKAKATAALLGRDYGGTFTFDEAALTLHGMVRID